MTFVLERERRLLPFDGDGQLDRQSQEPLTTRDLLANLRQTFEKFRAGAVGAGGSILNRLGAVGGRSVSNRAGGPGANLDIPGRAFNQTVETQRLQKTFNAWMNGQLGGRLNRVPGGFTVESSIVEDNGQSRLRIKVSVGGVVVQELTPSGEATGIYSMARNADGRDVAVFTGDGMISSLSAVIFDPIVNEINARLDTNTPILPGSIQGRIRRQPGGGPGSQ